MSSESRKFTVILDQETDGKYSVYCPSLPGCCSQGEDRADALSMIREAIELVLEVVEDRKREGDTAVDSLPLPETSELIAEELREALEFRLEEGDLVAMEVVRVEVPVPVSA